MQKKFLALLVAGLLLTLSIGCGRTPSRYLGEGSRQTLKVPDLKEFISMSFDKKGEATVKDVTYLATDGSVYTQEFKDLSPLEGRIRWVSSTESSSLIQSRTISRWLGSCVDLSLPNDCKKILGVDVGYAGPSERVKNLVYLTTDGRIMSKEYREGLTARFLEGWLEVKPEE